MQSVTAFILLAFARADKLGSMEEKVLDKLVDKLFQVVPQAASLRHVDLDDTTVRKPSKLAQPTSRFSPLSINPGGALSTSRLHTPSSPQCPFSLEERLPSVHSVGRNGLIVAHSQTEVQVAEQPAAQKVGQPVILHVCGSMASEYYEGVSIIYGNECMNSVSQYGKYVNLPCFVNLDGTWSFPTDTSEEARAKAGRLSFSQAMQKIAELKPEAVVPHMFCLPGMTSFRGLFDTMNIPIVGNPADVMALSEDKAKTRAVVAANGVKVPKAEILRKGENKMPTLKPPFLLKPLREANSQGLTFVKEGDDVQKALDTAFSFDSEVLCEEFVPLGREMRIAGLEMEDGSIKMLPGVEYFLTQESPVRTANDKLLTDERGVPTTFAPVDRKCPADIDDVLAGKLQDLVERSHKALGCRDYSLYDVRIDPQGEPYFIEACLYCSFAPKSVIVLMGEGMEPPLKHKYIYEMLVDRAIERGKRAEVLRSEGKVLGMSGR